MRMSPHPAFDGKCRAAFLACQGIRGREIATMLTHGESAPASRVDAQSHDRIIHATLGTGDIGPHRHRSLLQDDARPPGFCVTSTFDILDKAGAVFDALSEQGERRLPFALAFWSLGLGVLTDRFETPWGRNVAG